MIIFISGNILIIAIHTISIQNLEIFLVEIILQVSADQTRLAVVVSQQSLASLREQEEDYEAGSQ